MKKILSIFIICIGLFATFGISTTYAKDENKVISAPTTVDFPWLDCKCDVEGKDKGKDKCTGEVTAYKCNTGTGVSGFLELMKGSLKYITFLTGLVGVLYIIVNGILYSMGGIDPSMMDTAKKRIIGTLLGLILLLLSGPLLNLIAPWVYK